MGATIPPRRFKLVVGSLNLLPQKKTRRLAGHLPLGGRCQIPIVCLLVGLGEHPGEHPRSADTVFPHGYGLGATAGTQFEFWNTLLSAAFKFKVLKSNTHVSEPYLRSVTWLTRLTTPTNHQASNRIVAGLPVREFVLISPTGNCEVREK